MLHIFDTSSIIVLGHYFPERFPTFWQGFNKCVQDGNVQSTREVFKELDGHSNRPHLEEWLRNNKAVFQVPTSAELAFVGTIFGVVHFRQLVSERQRLRGTPVADPFVIAMAKVRGGCVVTEEAKKENAARIPTVCEHFRVPCCNLEQFMETNGWKF